MGGRPLRRAPQSPRSPRSARHGAQQSECSHAWRVARRRSAARRRPPSQSLPQLGAAARIGVRGGWRLRNSTRTMLESGALGLGSRQGVNPLDQIPLLLEKAAPAGGLGRRVAPILAERNNVVGGHGQWALTCFPARPEILARAASPARAIDRIRVIRRSQCPFPPPWPVPFPVPVPIAIPVTVAIPVAVVAMPVVSTLAGAVPISITLTIALSTGTRSSGSRPSPTR